MSSQATIYVLADSREADPVQRVRYVGRTTTSLERRMRAHKQTALAKEQTPRACWMRSVYESGGDVVIEPVAVVPSDACNQAEIDWVAHFRALGCPLMNCTDGGEGLLNPTAETRARIGAVKRGHKFWVGKKHTPEAKAKISASKIGKPMHPATRAKVFTSEVRAKISATHKAKVLTPEQLAFKREIAYRHMLSPEGKANLRAFAKSEAGRALRREIANRPEQIERIRQIGLSHRGKTFDQARKDQCAARQRGRTHTDATKAKMSAWQRGADSHRAKLTWDTVRDIRTRHAAGGLSQHALAREYQVTPRTVNLIVHGKTWPIQQAG